MDLNSEVATLAMDEAVSADAPDAAAASTAQPARYDSHVLISLGIAMGVIHVLAGESAVPAFRSCLHSACLMPLGSHAGPDHLCALATLSVGKLL